MISGNSTTNVDVFSASNVIEGNFIGTDANGAVALVNDGVGVNVEALNNTIGGTASGAGNVIAGSFYEGIELFGSGPSNPCADNVIQGNFIGTDMTGTKNLGNGVHGIFIDGASNNTIGGTASGAGNVIAYNTGDGIVVGDLYGPETFGNSILGNSIFSNTKLGIDLGADGVTLNDSQGHTGANLFQDFPVLSSAAMSSGGSTLITGTALGPKSTTIMVAFYANASADPSGYGQGKTFLGEDPVKIGAGGTGSFSFPTTMSLSAGEFITATATDASGNTSEFSEDISIVKSNHIVLGPMTTSASGFSVNRRTMQFTQTMTITNTTGSPIDGPVYLALLDLTAGVTLISPGSTPTSGANPPEGSPAFEISASGLGVNQSVTVTLVFSNPNNAVIDYTPELLSDPDGL